MLKCIKIQINNITKQTFCEATNYGTLPNKSKYPLRKKHIDLRNNPYLSKCYECRLFYVITGSGEIEANKNKYKFSNNYVIYFPPAQNIVLYLTSQGTTVSKC